MMDRRAASLAALLAAAGLVAWVRLVPLGLPAVAPRAQVLARGVVAARLTPPADARAVDAWIAAHPGEWQTTVAAEHARVDDALRYRDARGRRWPFLGDLDSYAWLRAARNLLGHGSACDPPLDGGCRDALTMAPVGLATSHDRSLHVAAIAALHRLLTAVDADFPLPASAFFVPVLAAMLGILPAFAIGRRLGGVIGGFIAAVVTSLQPLFLSRSIGSDNDVWNVVLPLYMAWALIGAVQARRRRDQCLTALLAVAIAGLHAVSWSGWGFGFVVLLIGLGAALGVHAAAWAVRRRTWRVWAAPEVRTIALVMLLFAGGTALAAELIGAQESTASALRRLGAALLPDEAPAPVGDGVRPAALSMVGELSVPTLGSIAAQSYGHLLFFAGWLGMLLLLLPRRGWHTLHFMVLVAGTLLYRVLLAAVLPPVALVALLALPLVAAVAVEVREGDDADLGTAAAGALIAVWLLAALLYAFSASRFIMLLAAPLGIATGVAAGRLNGWLAEELRGWMPTRWLADALAGGAVLALVLLPLRAGHATAAAYTPLVDSAWAGTFEGLRDTTPPDTIVSTWWDYGYWAKYYAERRVNADGGSLLTAVPYWLARAQTTADEAEAIGLLRMLDCGSDARPYPEGESGAMARLRRHGLDERAADEAVAALAVRDRAAAADHLAGLGLDPAARDAVLAATHCEPPPAVLVLSTEQVPLGGWWRLGRWRPGAAAEDQPAGLLLRDWTTCGDSGGERRCPVYAPDERGARIEAVVFPDGRPQEARIIVERDGAAVALAPSRLLLAGAMSVDIVATGDPSAPAVLLDGQQRALIGRPEALASLYVRLLFLDGRGLRHFRKLDERTGARNQRVAAWAVEW